MRSLIAAAFVLFIAGCQTKPVETPVVVECSAMDIKRDHPPGTALVGGKYGAAENTPIPLDAAQFTDNRLAKNIAVQGLYAERTPTDTVQVSARLVNCTDKTLAISARISFLKESQAPAESPSAWQNLILSPRATALYQENSVSRQAAHYLIEIRPNNQGAPSASEKSKSTGPL